MYGGAGDHRTYFMVFEQKAGGDVEQECSM